MILAKKTKVNLDHDTDEEKEGLFNGNNLSQSGLNFEDKTERKVGKLVSATCFNMKIFSNLFGSVHTIHCHYFHLHMEYPRRFPVYASRCTPKYKSLSQLKLSNACPCYQWTPLSQLKPSNAHI